MLPWLYMDKIYQTKEEVFMTAKEVLHKTLRDIMPEEAVNKAEERILKYGSNRKGYLGDLVEKYVFEIENNGRAEADFLTAGVELKTSPLKKHRTKGYSSKERLVFSMIDYEKVISEKWDSSSFLDKNKLLLLMFYLFEEEKNILDFEFKFIHFLNLLEDISAQDVEQIRKDWEFIISKVRMGEAHLLSEGDTFYLGACTKAKDGTVLRKQPNSQILAKPRAFSLKQTYLNYIVQQGVLGKKDKAKSIYAEKTEKKTIEEEVREKFDKYLGKTDKEIVASLGWETTAKAKNYKRLIANRILVGSGSNKIEELEKSNITLRVITLESSGVLKESISFPAFDYKKLINQTWDDEEIEKMSEFHSQLETKKFLFVIFQKIKNSKDIILKKITFWNFPMQDINEAEKVFNKAVACIKSGEYDSMPKLSESNVAHVRPHGKNSKDKIITPQGTYEMKRCFWLNAKYIQEKLEI